MHTQSSKLRTKSHTQNDEIDKKKNLDKVFRQHCKHIMLCP